jgi:hypothetical protein
MTLGSISCACIRNPITTSTSFHTTLAAVRPYPRLANIDNTFHWATLTHRISFVSIFAVITFLIGNIFASTLQASFNPFVLTVTISAHVFMFPLSRGTVNFIFTDSFVFVFTFTVYLLVVLAITFVAITLV